MRLSYRGAPLLDAAPFRSWLTDTMAHRGLTTTDTAMILGCDERQMRRLLGRTPDATPLVSELIVERAGIVLDDDPRLAAHLYPQLAH